MIINISIKTKIFLLVMASICILVLVAGGKFYQIEEKNVLDISQRILIENIGHSSDDIQIIATKAKDDLVMAVNNPIFKEYFALSSTQAGNKYSNGVLQFTSEQQSKKNSFEDAMTFFQTRFDIDEMCLIDKTGQEHGRITLRKPAQDNELSSNEKTNPFFEQAFAKKENEVHISDPYISTDTHQWVFSFTTPVVLKDSVNEAILHFELSLSKFQDIVAKNIANIALKDSAHDNKSIYSFIIDGNGAIVANSANPLTYNSDKDDISIEKFFPSIQTYKSGTFVSVWQDIQKNKTGSGSYTINGHTSLVVYKPLEFDGWSIVSVATHESLVGNKLESFIKSLSIIILIILVLIAIVLYFAISYIIKPINDLTKVVNNISQGKLDTVLVTTNRKDEIGMLSRAFERLIVSLKLAMREQTVTGPEIKEKTIDIKK